MLSRRNCLLGPLAMFAQQQARLVAHRGGDVGDGRPENSLAAMDEALRLGYWMIEIDIRSTKDGRAVLSHEPVEALTWEELREQQPGIVSFEQACERIQGRAHVMLDFKTQNQNDAFYADLARKLARFRLLDTAYALGGDAWFPHFAAGGAKISRSVNQLKKEVEAGRDVAVDRYLFELAGSWETSWLPFAKQHKLDAVAAVNTFRYRMAKRDDWEGPKEDIARLLGLGVDAFQIDGRYRPLFAQSAEKK